VGPRENYGLSETLTVTASPERCMGKTGVGLTLDSQVRICIKDSEICIQTPNMMMGYKSVSGGSLPQLELEDGWFRTGDLGEIDSFGYLHVRGRKKDLIIRGGLNVYPAEIEAVINSHPAVTKSAVVGISDPILGEDLIAVIEVVAGTDITLLEKEVSDLCKLKLALFKVPKKCCFTFLLPLTSSGKLKKQAIKTKVAEVLAVKPLSELNTLTF